MHYSSIHQPEPWNAWREIQIKHFARFNLDVEWPNLPYYWLQVSDFGQPEKTVDKAKFMKLLCSCNDFGILYVTRRYSVSERSSNWLWVEFVCKRPWSWILSGLTETGRSPFSGGSKNGLKPLWASDSRAIGG